MKAQEFKIRAIHDRRVYRVLEACWEKRIKTGPKKLKISDRYSSKK